jgi:hypothetical protein
MSNTHYTVFLESALSLASNVNVKDVVPEESGTTMTCQALLRFGSQNVQWHFRSAGQIKWLAERQKVNSEILTP